MGDNPAEEKENLCIVVPKATATAEISDAAKKDEAFSTPACEPQSQSLSMLALKARGTCCFLMKYGVCNPRNPPCKFYHPPEGEIVDDGVSPCAFGLACRQGHAKRVRKRFQNKQEKEAFWNAYYGYDSGESPAVRDPNLLQSQLEPWPTSDLRRRLVNDFEDSFLETDTMDRKQLMDRLLEHYSDRVCRNLPSRTVVTVRGGTPVGKDLCNALLDELQTWRRKQGNHNTRPSIKATSYLILRSPTEEEVTKKKAGTLSRRAAKALSKIDKHRSLWDLALKALELVEPHDPEFLKDFSALAVTYGFTGSPHIDKQNTGPFYGLSLGDFQGPINGGGCVCVEADAFTVAHVATRERLNKCDGRYPHWVSDYEGERYSLIYYSTSSAFCAPTRAFFGTVVPEGED
jgi:hypothetical protein